MVMIPNNKKDKKNNTEADVACEKLRFNYQPKNNYVKVKKNKCFRYLMDLKMYNLVFIHVSDLFQSWSEGYWL